MNKNTTVYLTIKESSNIKVKDWHKMFEKSGGINLTTL